MQLAQSDAVADDRLALGVAVGRDVGRVQQFLMPESTERSGCCVDLGRGAPEPIGVVDLDPRCAGLPSRTPGRTWSR
jgi:hypothetical protein